MCRLFAWHSQTPITLTQALGPDAHTLADLSRIHNDGWGMAYERGDHTERIRETTPAFESELFEQSSSAIATTAAIVHLRWATENLSVCEPNTHPFTKQGPSGPIAFIHNGGIARGAELNSLVDEDLLGALEGDTDSELYFAALLTCLRRTDGDMPAAFRLLLPKLEAIRHSSLNAMLLTDTDIYVLCRHNAANRPDGTDENYYELRWSVDAGVFTAWSSQVKPSVGTPMGQGDLVQVHRATGVVTVHRVI